jgi:hypothetical protein
MAGLLALVTAQPWLGAEAPGAVLPTVSVALSPVPEMIHQGVYGCARAYLMAHPGTELLLGEGGSMDPLYPDHTLLVTAKLDMSCLRRGMTVVFRGARGEYVAHALVAMEPAGWVTMGLANGAPDPTRVDARNYLGVVVKAFYCDRSPMADLLASQVAAPGLAQSGR